MNQIRVRIAEWLLLLILFVVPKGSAEGSDFVTFAMMYGKKWNAHWDEKIEGAYNE